MIIQQVILIVLHIIPRKDLYRMQKHIIPIRNEDMMKDIDSQGFTLDFYDIYKARSTYIFF